MNRKTVLAMFPVIALLLCSCDSILDSLFENSFIKVDGYNLSNKFQLDKPTGHFVIDNQATWDSTFFVINYFVDSADVTQVDFKNYFTICVVKRERKYWEMNPVKLSFNGNTIKYNYDAKCIAENMRWTAAITNIIMVKKYPYQQIHFYENDSLVAVYEK